MWVFGTSLMSGYYTIFNNTKDHEFSVGFILLADSTKNDLGTVTDENFKAITIPGEIIKNAREDPYQIPYGPWTIFFEIIYNTTFMFLPDSFIKYFLCILSFVGGRCYQPIAYFLGFGTL